MGALLLGAGTPSVYPPPQLPWGLIPQQIGYPGITGPFGSYGSYVPQQLQQLQVAVHQLLQTEFVQQQQIQQLLQIVPQQLQQIQHLMQVLALQPYQSPLLQASQPFLPNIGYPQPFLGSPSGWLGTSLATQPQIFAGQAGFGGQSGYVM